MSKNIEILDENDWAIQLSFFGVASSYQFNGYVASWLENFPRRTVQNLTDHDHQIPQCNERFLQIEKTQKGPFSGASVGRMFGGPCLLCCSRTSRLRARAGGAIRGLKTLEPFGPSRVACNLYISKPIPTFSVPNCLRNHTSFDLKVLLIGALN